MTLRTNARLAGVVFLFYIAILYSSVVPCVSGLRASA